MELARHVDETYLCKFALFTHWGLNGFASFLIMVQ